MIEIIVSSLFMLVGTDKLMKSAQHVAVSNQRPITSGNTTRKVMAQKFNGFAHKKLIIIGSQNRCVLPPDVMCKQRFIS